MVTNGLVVEAWGDGFVVRAAGPNGLGAVAVQVVTKQGQQVLEIDHVGSARTDAELALLLEAAAGRLRQGIGRSMLQRA
jgi:hypothetical protein